MDESTEQSPSELVAAAQHGDVHAFEQLVVRYQELALRVALLRLRDEGRARDAAQEAFIDAFLHLNQLREPLAFGRWFKRVLLKHCDRWTRAKTRGSWSELHDASDIAGAEGDPESVLSDAHRRAWLRSAIQALPEHERIAVALHYLADLPQREVAELLEIQPNTVKQRLHSARQRLERSSLEMNDDSQDTLAPPRATSFSDAVMFSLAVRSGDVRSVCAILERQPALVNAQERWELDDMRTGGLPVPTLAPPLVRAAATGDVAMIEALIAHGADVEGECGCHTRERPLFQALAGGHTDAARRLLAAGANPNAPGPAGHRALHVAAIRGMAAIVPLLLEHGADPEQADEHGRTAVDWARLKGRDDVVRLLTPTSAGPDKRSAAIEPDPSEREWSTGIKALDLFAPLNPGAIVRVIGGAMVGRNVALAELSLVALERNVPCLWATWNDTGWQGQEVAEFLAETTLEGRVELLSSGVDDSEEQRRALPERVIDRAAALLNGVGHVMVTIFEERRFVAEIEAILARVGRTRAGSITCLLVRRWQDVDGGAVQLRAPIDAVLQFDPALALIGHFPAVHPLHTVSSCAAGARDSRHAQIAERARALLRDYRDSVPALDPAARAGLPERFRLAYATYTAPVPRLATADARFDRARRLQAFLTQPFHSAEMLSGRRGVSVGRRHLLDGVQAILDGEADHLPIESLLYRGALDS